MTLYRSNSTGEVKSLEEWKQECSEFYQKLNLTVTPKDNWERYSRVIGIYPINQPEWSGRKPVKSKKEGLRGDIVNDV